MNEPATYEIVIRGRASPRLLRPLLHDFALDHTVEGVTRLIGEVCDTSHLHGVVAHLTSVGADLISIGPLASMAPVAPAPPPPPPPPAPTTPDVRRTNP